MEEGSQEEDEERGGIGGHAHFQGGLATLEKHVQFLP
jgi:hypothetical protein